MKYTIHSKNKMIDLTELQIGQIIVDRLRKDFPNFEIDINDVDFFIGTKREPVSALVGFKHKAPPTPSVPVCDCPSPSVSEATS